MKISRASLDRYIKKFKIKAPTYIQTDETRKRRSLSLKKAHKNDPTLSQRQSKTMVTRNTENKGKTFIEIFGEKQASEISDKMSSFRTGKNIHKPQSAKCKARKGKILSQSHRDNISKSRKKGILDGTIIISSRAGCGKGGYRDDIGHYVRSTYEHYYAQQLKLNKIKYFYEPKKFQLEIGGQQTVFIPDFYLIEDKKWIEIKNSYNVQDKKFLKKLTAFKEKYPSERIEIIVGDRTWIPTPQYVPPLPF